MTVCPRTCRISDDLFQNYEVIIDLTEHLSLDSICAHAKQNLLACLKKSNLHHLASLLDKRKFHIHNNTLEGFYNEGVESIIWICSGHKCNN